MFSRAFFDKVEPILPLKKGALDGNASIAQLVEHITDTDGVVGSNPTTRTKTKRMAPLKQKSLIEVSENPALAAGQYISDILSSHIGQPTLLLLAGGSSVEVFDHINPEYLSDKITVAVTDERFTDDISENNFDILQTTRFYDHLIQADAFCINTSVFAGDDIDEHAKRFEKNIQDWISEFPKGIIIGLYGMGTDGHIGGIIPGLYKGNEFEGRFNGKNLVATVIDPSRVSPFPERVSTTFTLMKKIDFPLIFMKGDEKREVLKKALDPKTKLEEMPAHIILELKNPVVFTDSSL